MKVFDRSFGKEKRVDTQMVADVMEDLYERIYPKEDVVVIVAGDQDHMPVLENVKGVRVKAVFGFMPIIICEPRLMNSYFLIRTSTT